MATSSEIIAEYAAMLPMWLNQLDLLEAEQQQLLTEMQEQLDGEGIVVEEAGVAGADIGDDPAEVDTSVWEEATTDDEEEIDPVGWLSGAATNAPEEGATPSADELGFDAPAASPSAPPVAPAGPVAATGVEEDEEGMASMFDRPADEPAILDDSALSAAPRGEEEANRFAASGDDPSVATLFEQKFGEPTHSGFLTALEEVEEAALPYALRETLRYATSKEEVAAAFVKTHRDGDLDRLPHLEEGVRGMLDSDYHFRDAAERYDTPDEGDDPILPLF